MIPFDERSPFVTSGMRIGTPAITTRGMKEGEMTVIGNMIDQIINNIDDEAVIFSVKKSVNELCKAFPLYSDLVN